MAADAGGLSRHACDAKLFAAGAQGACALSIYYFRWKKTSRIPPAGGTRHKLTLQFADAEHKSYGPAFAKTITVNVKG